MRLTLFSVLVASAWFLLANVLLSIIVWWLTPGVLARTADFAAGRRATAVLAWRAFPALASAFISVGVAWPSFLLHETSASDEPLRWWLVVAALSTLTLCATCAVVLASALADARRRVDGWLRRVVAVTDDATVVGHGLDTAAVAGIRRPRVFVGRALTMAMTSGELQAVIAHERAHVVASDNLKRAVLIGLPDLLRFTSRGAALVAAWVAATEDAADDAVARTGSQSAVDLAGALVKAARLTGACGAPPALVSSVAERGDVSRRVLRLLDAAHREVPARVPAPLAMLVLVAPAVPFLLGLPVTRAVHTVSEFLVNGRF